MIKGELYKIEFWDHSIGDCGIMKCEVVGWITAIDELSVTLTTWQCKTDCQRTWMDNLEPVSLVKTAIINKIKIGD